MPGDKRYIRRDDKGRIKESDDVSRSLSQDVRKSAQTAVRPGQGDKGHRKPAKKAPARKAKGSGFRGLAGDEGPDAVVELCNQLVHRD